MPRARPACSSEFSGRVRVHPARSTAAHHNHKRPRRKQLNHSESKQWQKNVKVAAATAMTGVDHAATARRLRRLSSGRLESKFFVKMTFLTRGEAARIVAPDSATRGD